MVFTENDKEYVLNKLEIINKRLEQLSLIETEARALGDLSENAEYESITQEKASLKQTKLQYAILASMPTEKVYSNVVQVGSKIKLTPVPSQVTYNLSPEGNFIIDDELTIPCKLIISDYIKSLGEGFLSSKTPLAKGLIGKGNGWCTVKVPGGQCDYKVEILN